MIKVIGKYVLDCDAKCYTIGILTKTKFKNRDGTITEKEIIQDPGYYSKLPDALLAICRRVERDAIKDTNGDLKALYEAVKASHERLERAITKAFPNIKIVEE
jgi:hypothetical protein